MAGQRKAKKPPTKIVNKPPTHAEPLEGLLAKKHQVLSRLVVEKNGYNDHSGYWFVQADDILASLKDLLADLGLVVKTDCLTMETETIQTTSGKPAARVTVMMKYTLTDIESGDYEESTAPGQGNDTGDKALYKALTGAYKYWAIQTFQIAGDSMDAEGGAQVAVARPLTDADREVAVKRAIMNAVYLGGWQKGTPEAKEEMEGAMHRLCDKFNIGDLKMAAPEQHDALILATRAPGFIPAPPATDKATKAAPGGEGVEVPTMTVEQEKAFQKSYRKQIAETFSDLTPAARKKKAAELVTYLMETMNLSTISEIRQNEITDAENHVLKWIRDNKPAEPEQAEEEAAEEVPGGHPDDNAKPAPLEPITEESLEKLRNMNRAVLATLLPDDRTEALFKKNAGAIARYICLGLHIKTIPDMQESDLPEAQRLAAEWAKKFPKGVK